jgi:hypothetical protein
LARYRRDGRLPPIVASLVRETTALRLRNLSDRWLAGLRPVLGRASATQPVARRRRTRMAVAGALASSSQALTHEFAERMTTALAAAGVDVFVVEREREHLTFGIHAAARGRAWAALRSLSAETAWYVDWERGTHTGTVFLRDRSLPRRLRRATRWAIYRAWDARGSIVGHEQAARLTFWELGTSGKQEMIGVRGQAKFDDRSLPTVETIDGRRYPGRTAFPVGNTLERFGGEIDVVYTWVDGSEQAWRAAFHEWSGRDGRDRRADNDLVAGRFRDNDELRHSLRSLWFGCDWVRKVFIVSADQVPRWLDTSEARIELVSHRDILPDDCLPTFNSHAIEAALHRIDGLAEHFVYFNDDVFVGRPLRPDHFFTSGGLPKAFLAEARITGVDDDLQPAIDRAAMRGRRLLRRDFGRLATVKPDHAPYPLRRTVIEELSKRYADEVQATMHHRFRHPDDVSVAASLAHQYGVATGQAVIASLASEYVHLESAKLGWHLDRLRLGRSFDTFCLNETEVVAADRDRVATAVAEFLAAYFPVAAPWELARAGA